MTPENLALLLMLVGILLFFLGFAAGAASMAFELHRIGHLLRDGVRIAVAA